MKIGLIKMKPQRIQRKRTKGWRMPPNTVYVGRGSKWGNPFAINRTYWNNACLIAIGEKYYPDGLYIKNVGQSLLVYKKYLKWALKNNILNLEELKGKNLACGCPIDQPCHADILLEITNGEMM